MSTGRRRILVVDDDESICNTLKLLLEIRGYDVDIANTGKQALEKAGANSYDVAILDIKLPDIEGTELLEPLRKVSPRMIRIMMTGYSLSSSAVKILSEDADAYFIKPVDPAKLVKTIEQKLDEQNVAADAP
jgi:DNA-binding NtrC family response regulator